MTALWRAERLTESELANYCRMSLSSLHRVVDRLEAKDFVKRSKDTTDDRRVYVELTARDRELSHLFGFHTEIDDTILEGMTPRERNQLTCLLERAVASVKRVFGEK